MAREIIWTTRAAAGLEMVTGASLFAAPSLLSELLFGSPLTAPGRTVGRVALAILCLAVGCWRPAWSETKRRTRSRAFGF